MEEKEIEAFKPSPTMYVLLFIFYTIWVLQAFGAIGFYFTFGFEGFDDYGVIEWGFVPLYCFGGLLCLYSVIKILRGDRDCITALKWALMYSFLYAFFNSSRAQIPTHNAIVILIVYLARPMFYLGFYIYLWRSKAIKRRYPKADRMFAPSGWAWVGVTVCLCGLVLWGGCEFYKQYQFCKRVDVGGFVLDDGLFCDGYVAFKSDLEWTASTGHTDTIYIDDDKVVCLQTMEATDSVRDISLFSGKSEKRDARTHNQILTRLLAPYDEDVLELCHRDSVVCGSHLISTSFQSKSSQQPVTYTVASIFDINSPKCIVLTSKASGVDSYGWLMDILGSLKWDLEDITKAKDEEYSNNDKQDVACRTGKNDYEANADLFGCLFDGRTPGFPPGIVLLQYHKGEIASRQGYYPFY